VRELQNVIGRAFILAEDDLGVDSLPLGVTEEVPATSLVTRVGTPIAEMERRFILATLDHCEGNNKRAVQAPEDQPEDPLQPAQRVQTRLIALWRRFVESVGSLRRALVQHGSRASGHPLRCAAWRHEDCNIICRAVVFRPQRPDADRRGGVARVPAQRQVEDANKKVEANSNEENRTHRSGRVVGRGGRGRGFGGREGFLDHHEGEDLAGSRSARCRSRTAHPRRSPSPLMTCPT
jgi:hypothetical protein